MSRCMIQNKTTGQYISSYNNGAALIFPTREAAEAWIKKLHNDSFTIIELGN